MCDHHASLVDDDPARILDVGWKLWVAFGASVSLVAGGALLIYATESRRRR